MTAFWIHSPHLTVKSVFPEMSIKTINVSDGELTQ